MANLNSRNPFSLLRWTHLKQTIFERARKCLAISLLLATVTSSQAAIVSAQTAAPTQASVPQTSAQQAVPPQGVPQQAPAPQSGPPQNQPANSVVMLPPGTKLPLGLLRPLRVRRGQDVYLQITFPVTVGNQMVIPPGAYLQGVIEKVIKKDRHSLQFSISSANLIFFNGYTVPISGTVTVSTTNAALTPPRPGPADGQPVPAMAAVGSVTPPSLPPLPPLPSMNGLRNAMIGVTVATAVGVTVLIVLAHNRDPEIEAGTPLEIILPAPVYLDATRVAAAIQQYEQQTSNAPVQIVKPPVKPPQPRMCYDPGTPSTPDTVIPGHPGTPDTVIPGVNGMPDTVIPGIPATPDTTIPGSGSPGTPGGWHECP